MATCLPRADEVLHQAQQIVRVLVVDEAVRPEGERLGADADVLNVGQRRVVDEGPHIALHHPGLHDHRIAARKQNVGDLGMGGEITVHVDRILRRDFQLLIAHELRPAEAERAVGVAGLTLAREEQHCLAILVLKTFQSLAFFAGDVELPLPGRMRVELGADVGGSAIDFLRCGLADHEIGDAAEVAVFQHAPLREHKPVDRIVRHAVPIDQVLDHIAVGAERQHGADDLHGEQVVVAHVSILRNRVEVPARQRLKLRGLSRGFSWITRTVRARPFLQGRRPRDRMNVHRSNPLKSFIC